MLSQLSVLLLPCVLFLIINSLAFPLVLNGGVLRSDLSPVGHCIARPTTLRHYHVNGFSELLLPQIPCILLFLSTRLVFSDWTHHRLAVAVASGISNTKGFRRAMLKTRNPMTHLTALLLLCILLLVLSGIALLVRVTRLALVVGSGDTCAARCCLTISEARHHLFVTLLLRIYFFDFVDLALHARFHHLCVVFEAAFVRSVMLPPLCKCFVHHGRGKNQFHSSQFQSSNPDLRTLNRFAAVDARVEIEG
jgi:hypothetical protein